MRLHHALVALCISLSCAQRFGGDQRLRIRQDDVSATDRPTKTLTDDVSNSDISNSNTTPTPSDPATTSNTVETKTPPSAPTADGDVTSVINIRPTSALHPQPTHHVTLPDDTLDPDVLPIQPRLTPGLGIAGAFLIISGLALCFVGIKHKPTQTFLSTSLLVALGTEVLIIYLMSPPVPNTIQGAYVIAGVVGGCAIGGLALIFKEMSEGFGCVLGGFTLAMWLLVLAPGGLIQNQVGRIILISLFCAACFCLYISRYTRVYGIIACTSFAGATSFILGIDCFSKAGLKEFWMFIWNLNNDVFPLYTDTYPINRNMRAEIAAIIIVTFFGIMSQIKIWKIVKEQRARRDADRLQEQEQRDAEEAELGRDIESQVARDRVHWEAHHDNKQHIGVGVESVTDYGEKGIHVDSIELTSSERGGRRHSLSSPLGTFANQLDPSRRKSAGHLNVLGWGTDKRASAVPSLPPLSFDFDGNHVSDKGAPGTPGTPGLSIGGGRGPGDLAANQETSPFEEEHEDEEEEDEEDLASSIAATRADEPEMDTLSTSLSRPVSMFMSYPDGNTPGSMQEEYVEDNDDEALCVSNNAGKRASKAGLTPPTGPGSDGEKESYFGDAAADQADQPPADLRDKLPRRISKAAATYRTNEWAKEVSRAEPVPIEEVEEHTHDAVQVEASDAAQAARAEENNAAPKPPTPPPQASVAKRSSKYGLDMAKRLSQHLGMSQAKPAPIPVYAHAVKDDDADWSTPLAQRQSSVPALAAPAKIAESHDNAPAPRAAPPRAKSPMPKISSRVGSSQSQNRPSLMPAGRISTLLDERRDRVENRLTTTSFMTPAPHIYEARTPTPSSPDGHRPDESSQGDQSSNTSITDDDRSIPKLSGEDMTLAERKALVQQQSHINLRSAAAADRHSQARGSMVTPERSLVPKPARISALNPNAPLYDSHRPHRIASHDSTKQAMNWSQWRSSTNPHTGQRPPYVNTDSQMDMLRAVRMQSEQEARAREREKKALQEQMDAHMRMGGMHDAHRAALAKMQGQANKTAPK